MSKQDMIKASLELAAKYAREKRWTLSDVYRAKAARLAQGEEH